MSFAKRLKERRESLGLTQEELSSRIGEDNGEALSRQSVSKWEQDNSKNPTYPEVQNLLRLSAELDISLDELFQDELNDLYKKKNGDSDPAERYPGAIAGLKAFAEALKEF